MFVMSRYVICRRHLIKVAAIIIIFFLNDKYYFGCKNTELSNRPQNLLEKGIGYLFQYSWAYLVAELVKKLPVMWET